MPGVLEVLVGIDSEALCKNRYFEALILGAILVNSVFLGLVDPLKDDADQDAYLLVADDIFMALFIVEMLVRLDGLGASTYFADRWNHLDFAVVMESIVSKILVAVGSEAMDLSFLRALRVLRPLRAVKRVPDLRRLLDAVLSAVGTGALVTALLGMCLLVFAAFAHVYWTGAMSYRCYDLATGVPDLAHLCGAAAHSADAVRAMGGRSCDDTSQFCGLWGEGPTDGYVSFDSMWLSLLTALRVVSYDRWIHVMWQAHDAVSPAAWVWFVGLVVFGSVCLVSLYPGNMLAALSSGEREARANQAADGAADAAAEDVVVRSQFEVVLAEIELASHQDTLELQRYFAARGGGKVAQAAKKAAALAAAGASKAEALPPLTPTLPGCFELRAYLTAELGSFSKFIYACILLNIVFMAADGSDADPGYHAFAEAINQILVVVFTIEACLKIFAIGPVGYFSDKYNAFDFFCVVTAHLETALAALSFASALRTLRLFRIARVLRLLNANKTAQKIKPTPSMDLSRVMNVTTGAASFAGGVLLLIMLGTYIFAVLGMQMFGGKLHGTTPGAASSRPPDPYQPLLATPRFNFDDIGHAFISAFDVMIGNRWTDIMYDAMSGGGGGAALYFVFWFAFSRWYLCAALTAGVFFYIEEENLKYITIGARQTMTACYQLEAGLERCLVARAFRGWKRKADQAGGMASAAGQGRVQIKDDDHVDLTPPTFYDYYASVDLSYMVFPPDSRFRQICADATGHVYFEGLILCFVILGSVTLAFESEFAIGERQRAAEGALGSSLYAIEVVVTLAFVAEFIMCTVARGVYWTPQSYLKEHMNKLDAVITFASVVALDRKLAGQLTWVKLIRMVRCLRPIKLLAKSPSTLAAVRSTFAAVSAVKNVAVVVGLLLVVFAVVGMQLFSGTFYRCSDASYPPNAHKSASLPGKGFPDGCSGTYMTENGAGPYERRWGNAPYHFDNFYNALLSVFAVFSQRGFDDILWRAVDAGEENVQPKRDQNLAVSLFFITFLGLSLFFTALIIGAIYGAYVFLTVTGDRRLASVKQAYWAIYASKLRCILPKRSIPPPDPAGAVAPAYYALMESPAYATFISFLVVGSIATRWLATTHAYASPHDAPLWVVVLDACFVGVYVGEWAVRLLIFGPARLFITVYQRIDALLNVAIGVYIALELTRRVSGSDVSESALELFLCLTVFRVVRFLDLYGGFELLLDAVQRSMSTVVPLVMLGFVTTYTYAIVGVVVFGPDDVDLDRMQYPDGTSSYDGVHGHFRRVAAALQLLFAVATGGDYSNVMMMLVAQSPDGSAWLAPLYFISFVAIVKYMLLAVCTLVITYNLVRLDANTNGLAMSEVHKFRQSWQTFDSHGVGEIAWNKLPELIRLLGAPLGTEPNAPAVDADRLARQVLRKIRPKETAELEALIDGKAEAANGTAVDAAVVAGSGGAPAKHGTPSVASVGALASTPVADLPDHLNFTVGFTDAMVTLHELRIFKEISLDTPAFTLRRNAAARNLDRVRYAVARALMLRKRSALAGATADKVGTAVAELSLMRARNPDVFRSRFAKTMVHEIYRWSVAVQYLGYTATADSESDYLCEALREEAAAARDTCRALRAHSEAKIEALEPKERLRLTSQYHNLLQILRRLVLVEREGFVTRTWEVDTMRPVAKFNVSHAAGAVACSSAGDVAVVAAGSKLLVFVLRLGAQLTAASTTKLFSCVQSVPTEAPTLALAMTPDGKRLFAAGQDGRIRAFLADPRTFATRKGRLFNLTVTMAGHDGPVYGLALKAGFLLSAGADATVKMWLPRSKDPIATTHMATAGGGRAGLFCLCAYTPEIDAKGNNDVKDAAKSFCFAGSHDGLVGAWEVRTDDAILLGAVWAVAARVRAFPDGQAVSAIAAVPEWNMVYAGGASGAIAILRIVWQDPDAKTAIVGLQPVGQLRSHAEAVTALVPAGGALFSTSRDMSTVTWLDPTWESDRAAGGAADEGRPAAAAAAVLRQPASESSFVGHAASILGCAAAAGMLVSVDEAGTVIFRVPQAMREHKAIDGVGGRDVLALSAAQQRRVQLRLKQLVISRRSMLTMLRAMYPAAGTSEYADVVAPDVVWVDGAEGRGVADMIPTHLRKAPRAPPRPFETLKHGTMKPLFSKRGRFTRRVPLALDDVPAYGAEHFVAETVRWYYPDRSLDMEITPNETFRIEKLKADASKRTELALSCVLDKGRFVAPPPAIAAGAVVEAEDLIVPGHDPERDQDARASKTIKVDVADRTVALPYAPREKVRWVLDEAKRMYHADAGEAVNADMLVVSGSTAAPLALDQPLTQGVAPGAKLTALLGGKPARAYVVGKLELDLPIDKIGALDSVTGLRFQAKFKADLAGLANIKTSRVQVSHVADEPEDHCVVVTFKLVNDASDKMAPTPMMALRSLQATLEREGSLDVAAATVVLNSIVDATPRDGVDDEQPPEAFLDFEYAGTVAAQAAGAVLLLPFAPLALVGAGAVYGAAALSNRMDGAVDAGSGFLDSLEAMATYPSLALPSLLPHGGGAGGPAEDEWESVTDDDSEYEDGGYDDDDWGDDDDDWDDDGEEETIYSGTTVTGGSWDTESLAMSVGDRGRRRGGVTLQAARDGQDFEALDAADDKKRRASMLRWTAERSGGVVSEGRATLLGSDVTGSGYDDDTLYDEDYYGRAAAEDPYYYAPSDTPEERAAAKRRRRARKSTMKQWMSTRRFASKLAEREADLRHRPRGATAAVVAHEIGLAAPPAMSVADWIANKTTLGPAAADRCAKALNDAGFDDVDALASPYAALTDAALAAMGVELMGERVSLLGALDALRAEKRAESAGREAGGDVSAFETSYGLTDQLRKLELERQAERAERSRQLDEIAELRQLVLAAMIDPEKRQELAGGLGARERADDDDESVATSFFTRAYQGATGANAAQARGTGWFGLGAGGAAAEPEPRRQSVQRRQSQSVQRRQSQRRTSRTEERRPPGGGGDGVGGGGGPPQDDDQRSYDSRSYDSRDDRSYSDYSSRGSSGYSDDRAAPQQTPMAALKAEQDAAATRLQSISRRRSSQRMVSEKKQKVAATAAANARSPAVTSGVVHGVDVGVTRIRRNFPGFGTFEGLITAYAAPFFTVVYNDGDEEEMPVDELRACELIDENGMVFRADDGRGAGQGGGGGGVTGVGSLFGGGGVGATPKRAGSFLSESLGFSSGSSGA